MALRFEEVQDLILYELYWFLSEPDSPEDVDPSIIKEILQDQTSIVFIDEAISALREDGYVVDTGVLPNMFSINAKGLKYVDDNISKPATFLGKYHEKSLYEHNLPVPASDRVVSIDHNKPEYLEAIETLEKTVAEAGKSNEFGNLFADPEDRVRVLSEINSGITLFRNTRVKIRAITDVLISNLRLIANKLPDAALGALASRALELIAKVLGGG